jgi:hypothetical protein
MMAGDADDEAGVAAVGSLPPPSEPAAPSPFREAEGTSAASVVTRGLIRERNPSEFI